MSKFIVLLVLLLWIPYLRMSGPAEAYAWTGTIWINPDGSLNPPSAPLQRNGDLYILYSDVDSFGDGIVIEKDNIIVDGTGHTVRGAGIAYSKGVYVEGKHNVTLKNLTITAFECGVVLNQSASNCVVQNNIVCDNGQCGVYFEGSFNNSCTENIITGNFEIGILFHEALFNNLRGNNITANWNGIDLRSSHNNSILRNDMWSNIHLGMSLCLSENNSIVHNSFVNNLYRDVSVCENLNNKWDQGCQSGGNYWHNFSEIDAYSGPYQNESGSDGIGDEPHVLDENNMDMYPLMGPWTEEGENVAVIHPFGVSLSFANVTSSGVTIVNRTMRGPSLPSRLLIVDRPASYYGLHTTTSFVGLVNVSISYDDVDLNALEEESLSVVRWNYTSGTWENVTVTVDTNRNIAYGVTTELAIFALTVPLLGDTNGDGTVDIYDAIQLAGAFGSSEGSPKWNSNVDINRDDIVDIYDAIILASNYGKSGQS